MRISFRAIASFGKCAAAQPGDIIILSPASASFDLYPNFEVRGREFKKIVNELK